MNLIVRSDLFAGITMSIESIAKTLEKINLPVLVNYAIRYGVGPNIMRLGWALETNDV